MSFFSFNYETEEKNFSFHVHKWIERFWLLDDQRTYSWRIEVTKVGGNEWNGNRDIKFCTGLNDYWIVEKPSVKCLRIESNTREGKVWDGIWFAMHNKQISALIWLSPCLPQECVSFYLHGRVLIAICPFLASLFVLLKSVLYSLLTSVGWCTEEMNTFQCRGTQKCSDSVLEMLVGFASQLQRITAMIL